MKRLKEDMLYLGLSPMKEVLWYGVFALALLGLGALLWIWRGFGFLLLFPLLGLVAFTLFYFSRYGTARRAKLEALTREFVDIFTFFSVFLGDGFTVYAALQKAEEYASEDFKPRLENLLRQIDEDKSVTPFVDFASAFEDSSVKEVMLAVYQMVDEGEGGTYLRQFQKLFGRLSDTRHAMDMEKRLTRLDNLAFLPLAGAGIAMLTLTLSIMEIMGGLTDVL